jgi:hypothetical protein
VFFLIILGADEEIINKETPILGRVQFLAGEPHEYDEGSYPDHPPQRRSGGML